LSVLYIANSIALFFLVASLACSPSTLDGRSLPSRDVTGKRYAVVHRSGDSRDIDQLIVGLLQARGLEAAVSPMESPDYVVSYVDKWYWDMRTYMIDFRVDIRNAETNELVATGRSFQTSVVDGRDTYDKIVEAALNTALVAPKTPKPAAKRRRVSS
jgi:hypothetical protein